MVLTTIYKKTILAIILSLTSNVVTAEWIFFSKPSAVNYSTYVNFNTFKRDGSQVTFWVLRNFDKEQSIFIWPFFRNKYMSAKVLNECDCQNAAINTIYAVYYQKPMGKGYIVKKGSVSDKEFEPAIPDTVGYSLMNKMCGSETSHIQSNIMSDTPYDTKILIVEKEYNKAKSLGDEKWMAKAQQVLTMLRKKQVEAESEPRLQKIIEKIESVPLK